MTGRRRGCQPAAVGVDQLVVQDVARKHHLAAAAGVLAQPWGLERIPPGWRAIVVDNGSHDGSAAIATEFGATVVSEPRRGYGAACHAGLLAADAEFVCFCDYDASLDPALLVRFVDRIAVGDADLVLSRRQPTARGAFPQHARAGKAALMRMLRRRTGLRLRDLGPMRAARRRPCLTSMSRTRAAATRWKPWSWPPRRAGASPR